MIAGPPMVPDCSAFAPLVPTLVALNAQLFVCDGRWSLTELPIRHSCVNVRLYLPGPGFISLIGRVLQLVALQYV